MPRDSAPDPAERPSVKALLQFTSLRLAGFKSFVDSTELVIGPGLTGIVGPNGCGKSNLVEALRWAMGETSAREMRGGEMDDVIFGGTSTRPARNVAEVVIAFDTNGAENVPAPFDGVPTIEISRRIERERGSAFRVNGKHVRARDVQLLFADAATGARSAALISQGQVGSLIAAKPRERRALLEEAAGITGLHSRRHEAELRLQAAEANLERLEDVLATLEVQLQSLNKQAKQAARYRKLCQQIRETEALLYALRWRSARQEVEEAERRLTEATRAAHQAVAAAHQCGERRAEAMAVLPGLRQADADAAAELQRLSLARDGLDAEERRVDGEQRAARLRLDQANADLQRERTLLTDADAALARLVADERRIEAACQDEQQSQSAAAAALAEVSGQVEQLDAAFAAATAEVAAIEAKRTALLQTCKDLQARKGRLASRAADLASQQVALNAKLQSLPDPARTRAELGAVNAALEQAKHGAAAAEERRITTAAACTEAVTARQAAAADQARLRAEEEALAEVLAPSDGAAAGVPVLDMITAEPGYETAVAAALGDDLLAPLWPAQDDRSDCDRRCESESRDGEETEEGLASEGDGEGDSDGRPAVAWRALAAAPGPCSAPPLPPDVNCLALFVSAPPALARRLAQVGLVTSDEEGFRRQHGLAAGQRLVSRQGDQWRWDGLTVNAGASAASARLRQRNRLNEVTIRRLEADDRLSAAGARAEAAQSAADEAAGSERAAREALRAAEAARARAREADMDARERRSRIVAQIAALKDAQEGAAAEHAEAEVALADRAGEVDRLGDSTSARANLDRLRSEVAAKRAEQAERRAAADALAREAEGRRRRLNAIGRERESWHDRREAATRQLTVLEDRRERAEQEQAALADLPATFAARRRSLVAEIEAAAQARQAAAERLASAEAEMAEADRRLRAAETAVAGARESELRAEAAAERTAAARSAIAERIAETLGVEPESLEEAAAHEPESEVDPATVERRLDRMRRDRDVTGPVNLRAEQEAAELSDRITTLAAERGDLLTAVGKLRQGLAELDREGRERLLASFADVDRHFRELFVRLFNGGRAHLSLTESDDPLDAGLEIMASPPGKRLQSLSLMSGGEQALATLALVFAVFLTTPAPICVLDEVDAPLDDANVDRLCSLLGDLSASTGTRFIVITHHRMTMARMDRLFGVTMSERGVSRLVSVELSSAEELSDSG